MTVNFMQQRVCFLSFSLFMFYLYEADSVSFMIYQQFVANCLCDLSHKT